MADVDRTSLINQYLKKSLEKKTLEILSFGVGCVCSQHMLTGLNSGLIQHLDTYIIPSWSKSIISMAAKWYCPGELKKEIRYPLNWVEAIKDRWLPGWALHRWPVRYHVTKIYDMYPEVKIPLHSGHRVSVFVSETTEPVEYE